MMRKSRMPMVSWNRCVCVCVCFNALFTNNVVLSIGASFHSSSLPSISTYDSEESVSSFHIVCVSIYCLAFTVDRLSLIVYRLSFSGMAPLLQVFVGWGCVRGCL